MDDCDKYTIKRRKKNTFFHFLNVSPPTVKQMEQQRLSLGAIVCTRVEIKLFFPLLHKLMDLGSCGVQRPLISCTESPAASLALRPWHTEGKQQGRRGGGLGNLSLHLSIVIFISFILTRPLFLLSSTSCFLSSFFFSSQSFCSYHILSYLSSTPSWAVCLSLLTLLLFFLPFLASLRSSMFQVIWPGLCVPLCPLLQNSVSLPFPISRPPAPRLPLPLLPKWPGSMINCVSPGWAPGPSSLPFFHLQVDHERLAPLSHCWRERLGAVS